MARPLQIGSGMPAKRYAVLVGIDFSKLADRAFARAFEVAALNRGGELHVLHVLPIAEVVPVKESRSERNAVEHACVRLHNHVQLLLEDVLSVTEPLREPHITSHVRVNDPSAGLVQMAADLGADLIVLGTHGRDGLDRWLMGSVSESTARHARCPVLIVPPHEPNPEMLLEPPCSDCVLARHASAGAEIWCQRHQEHHGHRHTYHQADRTSRNSNLPFFFR